MIQRTFFHTIPFFTIPFLFVFSSSIQAQNPCLKILDKEELISNVHTINENLSRYWFCSSNYEEYNKQKDSDFGGYFEDIIGFNFGMNEYVYGLVKSKICVEIEDYSFQEIASYYNKKYFKEGALEEFNKCLESTSNHLFVYTEQDNENTARAIIKFGTFATGDTWHIDSIIIQGPGKILKRPDEGKNLSLNENTILFERVQGCTEEVNVYFDVIKIIKTGERVNKSVRATIPAIPKKFRIKYYKKETAQQTEHKHGPRDKVFFRCPYADSLGNVLYLVPNSCKGYASSHPENPDKTYYDNYRFNAEWNTPLPRGIDLKAQCECFAIVEENQTSPCCEKNSGQN